MRSSNYSFGLIALAGAVISTVAGFACGGGSTGGDAFGAGGGNTSLGAGGRGGGLTTSSSNPTSSGPGGDPKTCAQAEQFATYIGCDFWPTVTANNVWHVFDYAVVVTNAGDTPATVTVEQNGAMVGSPVTVMPNSLAPIYLPWVKALKGEDWNGLTAAVPFPNSVLVNGGAYHLTSSSPVTVYQFNAIEYAGDASKGGPPGKDWSQCPNNAQSGVGCFSYSNDASLLLPSTAMTGNYRVAGHEGWVDPNLGPVMGPTVTITGTKPNTTVTVSLSATGHVVGGGPITDTPANGVVKFTLNAGDVAQLAGDAQSSFGGSLVQATAPVQVLTGVPCLDVPSGVAACDHVEESVLPAETLGRHYIVAKASGPHGTPVGQLVKLFGNVNGTHLTYPAGVMPPTAPPTIDAGQVIDLGIVTQDFEIKGDHEFAISTFTQGAVVVDPQGGQTAEGDPDQSQTVAVEQFRTKYIFLAPTDYPENYVDVLAPAGSNVTIDGVAVPANLFAAIGSSNYQIAHLQLAAGNAGAHELLSSQPAGIQVVGYGSFTSYMYPGGLNLDHIAPPPPPPK